MVTIYELKDKIYKYGVLFKERTYGDKDGVEFHLLNNLLLLGSDTISVIDVELVLKTTEHKILIEAKTLTDIKQNSPELFF